MESHSFRCTFFKVLLLGFILIRPRVVPASPSTASIATGLTFSLGDESSPSSKLTPVPNGLGTDRAIEALRIAYAR